MRSKNKNEGKKISKIEGLWNKMEKEIQNTELLTCT